MQNAWAHVILSSAVDYSSKEGRPEVTSDNSAIGATFEVNLGLCESTVIIAMSLLHIYINI